MKLLTLLLCIMSFSVFATERPPFPHHPEDTNTTIIEQTIIEQTITTETSRYSTGAGIAGAMAQHHFDYGSYALQKSIGFVLLDNEDEENVKAFSVSGAKRNCRDCGLVNFTFAVETNPYNNKLKRAYGVGYTWMH